MIFLISFSFKLFPNSKIDFWPFLKLQKMDFGKKKNRSFFGLDFFNFLAYCVIYENEYKIKYLKKNLLQTLSSSSDPSEQSLSPSHFQAPRIHRPVL